VVPSCQTPQKGVIQQEVARQGKARRIAGRAQDDASANAVHRSRDALHWVSSNIFGEGHTMKAEPLYSSDLDNGSRFEFHDI
jgi:hypothetical protein